jgi:hypothetical protein
VAFELWCECASGGVAGMLAHDYGAWHHGNSTLAGGVV